MIKTSLQAQKKLFTLLDFAQAHAPRSYTVSSLSLEGKYFCLLHEKAHAVVLTSLQMQTVVKMLTICADLGHALESSAGLNPVHIAFEKWSNRHLKKEEATLFLQAFKAATHK